MIHPPFHFASIAVDTLHASGIIVRIIIVCTRTAFHIIGILEYSHHLSFIGLDPLRWQRSKSSAVRVFLISGGCQNSSQQKVRAPPLVFRGVQLEVVDWTVIVAVSHAFGFSDGVPQF
jgi:hypothetical protein